MHSVVKNNNNSHSNLALIDSQDDYFVKVDKILTMHTRSSSSVWTMLQLLHVLPVCNCCIHLLAFVFLHRGIAACTLRLTIGWGAVLFLAEIIQWCCAACVTPWITLAHHCQKVRRPLEVTKNVRFSGCSVAFYILDMNISCSSNLYWNIYIYKTHSS